MITEIIYDGHDNTIDLLLKADEVATDLSSVTRMTLDVDTFILVDSAISGECFDWSTGVTGKVILALGGEGIDEGLYRAKLTVYDSINTDGIVWGEFNLTVR